MLYTTRFELLSIRNRYLKKVLRIDPTPPIALWALDEKSYNVTGTAVRNLVNADRRKNGTYVNAPSLGQTGIGDGGYAPLFLAASTQYVDVFSSTLATAFNNQEGSLMAASKVNAAGDWTDGVNHRIVLLGVDINNFVRIGRSAASTVGLSYVAGGTTKTQSAGSESSTGWIVWLLTWSKGNDRVLGYRNGVSLGAAVTSLGAWSGTLVTGRCLIGADAGPAATWQGYLDVVAVWPKELSAAQATTLSVVP